ncbi:hypothetical protein [Colwellia piezophila]|uniref:hypothetical protein n=1 Tax=Colwellia piezophila TaxID=211668 RepID=UPI00035D0183|nr:hypothetical protein [Colwellia piezophila]
MNSIKTHFSKMALALLFSVTGMLLSLSALAMVTANNDVKHEQHTIEVKVDTKAHPTHIL